MDVTTTERDRRWKNVRSLMQSHDVDVVIAYSDFGDQASLQRYISNFRSSYDYQATLLYRDDGCDLVVSHPGSIPIAKQLSWANDVLPTGGNGPHGPSVGGQIASRLADREITRVGVAGMEYFPVGWKASIEAANPNVEFVDVWDDIHLLRLVKGKEEQALVREAARISDEIWELMPEIVQAGRKRYEVLADVEQMIRASGCEDSFNLCMSMPMLAEPLDRNPYSALPIEDGGIYLIEVSPRYLGYYGQQTTLVAMDTLPTEMRQTYDAVNRARDAGLEIVKPGVDLAEVGEVIAGQLRSDGYEPAGPSFGHAVGMELEDHHINGGSLVLEEGMTFIFHPMAAGHPGVMRADTYLITESGFERLTSQNTDPVELKRN